MKSFTHRYLLLVAFTTVLAGCQSAPTDHSAGQPDAWQVLQQSIASSELATAEEQLAALQSQTPNDPRIEQFQRELAEAYLRRSQVVLQKGDVNAAATALGRARALMPKAPALTRGVDGAIANARRQELEQAEAALKIAEARPAANMIDPAASHSAFVLENGRGLASQLDAIAADIVNYNCDVIVQVADPRDYRRLEAQLKQRVEKLAPGWEMQIGRRVETGRPNLLVLTPRGV
ncbi:PA5502 family lipoprotein [Pseudomonas sp. nanlin1]|uniref:PA5502 family lipoprotein n=1 Tax=Pseudomonas sp. nanlin1 TaxID=3040605 RepID=UPI003890A57D